MPQVWLWVGPGLPPSLPLQAQGRETMKLLLLAGLGALFFAYYWDDHFDPGECLLGGGGGRALAGRPLPPLQG